MYGVLPPLHLREPSTHSVQKRRVFIADMCKFRLDEPLVHVRLSRNLRPTRTRPIAMLNRIVLAATLVVMAAAPTAQAGSRYTDPQGRFSVDVPAEWEAGKPEGQKVALVMGRQDGTDMVGACIVVVTETPQTNGRGQPEITDAMNAMLTRDFWVATYRAQGAQDINVAQLGTRDGAGRKVHFVYSEFTTRNQDGSLQRVRAQEEVHAVPGRTHDIGCIARKDRFDRAKVDFDAIQKSYTPQSGLIAAAPIPAPGQSMLTLFANAGFDGMARIVRAETPNIAQVSWPTMSGSAVVHGYGEWQVCEGPNFTGVCMNLNGPVTAAANTALRIGSARPVVSSDALRGLGNAVATGSMSTIAEALKKVHK